MSQRQSEDPASISKDDQNPGSSLCKNHDKPKPDDNSSGDEMRFFKYSAESKEITFMITSDGLIHCYYCQKPFKMIVQHIKKSSECSNDIDIEDLKSKLAVFKQTTGPQRSAKSRGIKINRNPEGYKAAEAQRKANNREIQKKKDPEGYKASEASRKSMSRLHRKRKQNETELENRKPKESKQTNSTTSKDRLLKFLQATLYNAIFICTCCHQRCFRTNVTELTKELRDKINSKKPGLLMQSIENPGNR